MNQWKLEETTQQDYSYYLPEASLILRKQAWGKPGETIILFVIHTIILSCSASEEKEPLRNQKSTSTDRSWHADRLHRGRTAAMTPISNGTY